MEWIVLLVYVTFNTSVLPWYNGWLPVMSYSFGPRTAHPSQWRQAKKKLDWFNLKLSGLSLGQSLSTEAASKSQIKSHTRVFWPCIPGLGLTQGSKTDELPGGNTFLRIISKDKEKGRNFQEAWCTPTQTMCSLVVDFRANVLQIWGKVQDVFTYLFFFFWFSYCNAFKWLEKFKGPRKRIM